MLSGTGIGVEGGHMIENDMKKLDSLQKRGALEIIALRNPSQMVLATNYKQVKKGIRQEKLVG
jgi:hypothetical protein